MVRPRWGDVIVDGWPPIGSMLNPEALRRAMALMEDGEIYLNRNGDTFRHEYYGRHLPQVTSNGAFDAEERLAELEWRAQNNHCRVKPRWDFDWLRYAPIINTGGS